MPRIAQEYLISSQATTPQTDILIGNFYSTFDNRSGVNRRISNVEPLHYSGAILGSEFLTYAVTKMYLCLSCFISYAANHGEIEGYVIFNNAADAAAINVTNKTAYWESLGAKDEFIMNPILIENFYFSRLTYLIYSSIIFTGWRMTLE